MVVRLVLEDDVQCVDDTGNVAQDREQDVDEEICAATTLEEDSERWEEDGEDDFDDITAGERHGCCFCRRFLSLRFVCLVGGVSEVEGRLFEFVPEKFREQEQDL